MFSFEQAHRPSKSLGLALNMDSGNEIVPEPFSAPGDPGVRGSLHRAANETAGLVLTHSAGSNCDAPLLIAVAESLCAAGLTVLRCDLPFRQARPHGPPLRTSALDQAGLHRAVEVLRRRVQGDIFLGGHSYGGRMASILTADQASIVQGLLLLSYPLHPPHKPQQLRTAHFDRLRVPAFFVHGSRDPFGSILEMESALKLIPVKTELFPIEGTGHELLSKSTRQDTVETIVRAFVHWTTTLSRSGS